LVSYKLDPARQRLIHEVASRRGLVVADHQPARAGTDDQAGMPARVRDGDIVVASGRGAIEAMLCGRVPLIMANCGDDGLVTIDNFDALMAFNFSGRASGQTLDEYGFARALDRYTPQLGRQLQAVARQHLGLGARRAGVLSMFEALAAVAAPGLGHEQLELIRFQAETLAQQREFARRTEAMRRESALGAGPRGWKELLAAGHRAWRGGDTALAFEAYLKAFQAPGEAAAPAHSLASNLLVQLASREKRGAHAAGQRAALQAFLQLNPDNAWALQQLQALAAEPPPAANRSGADPLH
jgi:hypothetical protein